MGLAIGDEIGLQRRAALLTWHQLHHRLHLFTQVVIGHTKHRSIGHLGMDDQQVLALLRIDVDPAADDHEGGAIRQVQKAVIVHIANVAHGTHRAVA